MMEFMLNYVEFMWNHWLMIAVFAYPPYAVGVGVWVAVMWLYRNR
jgi:hypothetical protein